MNEENFKLTEDQEELVSKLKAFIEGTERMFLLEGPPGTGKTTSNKISLKEYIDADIKTSATGANINVAGITLAHSAKNVLGEYIPNVFTFASAFGMKEIFHKDGSRSFEFKKYHETTPIGHCSIPIFVHDEVSQYNTEMIRIMLENTPMFSKIILIGDKGQLPPIERPGNARAIDADSAIFDLEIPDECRHTLNEIVRQKAGNPILELSQLIRKETFGGQNLKKVLNEIKDPKFVNGSGYGFVTYNNLNEDIKGKDYRNTAVIAFRKKTVSSHNFNIRNYLLDNPQDSIVDNDVICMLDNFYATEEYNDKEVKYVLHNSDVFYVEKVFQRNLKHTVGNTRYTIPVYQGKVKGEKDKFIIVPTREGQVKLDESLGKVSNACREGKLPWSLFWKFYKKFCNCGYGYAITAYKCQGATYKTVYVDINDILMTGPLTPKRKLQTIYTAITRATDDVYFLKAR